MRQLNNLVARSSLSHGVEDAHSRLVTTVIAAEQLSNKRKSWSRTTTTKHGLYHKSPSLAKSPPIGPKSHTKKSVLARDKSERRRFHYKSPHLMWWPCNALRNRTAHLVCFILYRKSKVQAVLKHPILDSPARMANRQIRRPCEGRLTGIFLVISAKSTFVFVGTHFY